VRLEDVEQRLERRVMPTGVVVPEEEGHRLVTRVQSVS
jgi:hypothetical protein